MHIVDKTQSGQFAVLLAFHYLALHPDVVVIPIGKESKVLLVLLALDVVLDRLLIMSDHEGTEGTVVLDGLFVLLDYLLGLCLFLFLPLLDGLGVVFLVAYQ